MSQFDWPITQKKIRIWKFTKIEGFILKYRVPPLLPTYIGKKRKHVKNIWDKSEVLRTCKKTHWELGEHSDNLMKTIENL
jgi:hypothetical protein